MRKRKGDKDYFVPVEVFRDGWLGMLEHLDPASHGGGTLADVVPIRKR